MRVVLHPGKFDGIEDMVGFQGLVSARKPRKYLAYKMVPEQYFVYGSSRLGSIYHYKTQREISGRVENTNRSGERRYELSDHLGNVQVVMSDRLAQADTGGSSAVDAFEGDVWSVMDYYPFGMLMRDRSANMEELRLERSMFTDTVEVVTWTKKIIDQPNPTTGAFQQPLDASNRKFKGKAWASTTDQTANPDFADSTTQSSPIVYQYNGTSTEMQLAGLGYKSMRIEYNINSATVPALAANDSFVVQLTAIFDGSYKNTRVEIRDHSSNQLIKQQVITNPPNNFGTPVTIGFGVGSLDSVDIIIRAEFTNTASYVPDLSYQGVSNWTNGIYLRNWHLTHYRRNSKQEVVSDTSDYFYRNKYLFSFQGQEADDEIRGSGNTYNYLHRMHDSRLGRFFSVDPLASEFPWNSTYAFSENIVISHIELEGLEKAEPDNLKRTFPVIRNPKSSDFERLGEAIDKVKQALEILQNGKLNPKEKHTEIEKLRLEKLPRLNHELKQIDELDPGLPKRHDGQNQEQQDQDQQDQQDQDQHDQQNQWPDPDQIIIPLERLDKNTIAKGGTNSNLNEQTLIGEQNQLENEKI